MCMTGCLEAGGEGGAKAGGTASQVVGGVGQAHQAARCEAHLQLCQTNSSQHATRPLRVSLHAVLRIRIRNPESGTFLNPGSGMVKK
jgi:hypothetical protein